MVQVMGRYDFILDAFVVHLDCMLSIVTSEHEQVLHCELLSLGPSQLQTGLLHFRFPLECLCIQKVKHFLIVDLQERAVDIHRLGFLSLLCLAEHLMNRAHCQPIVRPKITSYLHLASTFLPLALLVLVALHRVCLA